jgi:hypothetical protein
MQQCLGASLRRTEYLFSRWEVVDLRVARSVGTKIRLFEQWLASWEFLCSLLG